MKYLFLFEGFKEDFLKQKAEIDLKWSEEKRNLLEETKFQVDQFMYELTDDYSHRTEFQNDFIDIHANLPYIVYFLKSSASDLDDVLSKLDSVEKLIKSNFDLDMEITCSGLGSGGRKFSVNHGFKTSYERLVIWIDRFYRGLRDDLKEEWTHFTFEINFN
jgi:acid phosphatase class B